MLLCRQFPWIWHEFLASRSIWSKADCIYRLHCVCCWKQGRDERWLTFCSALVGAVLQTAAQNIEMLFVGRVIGGIASGLVFGVCPMFMSEISPPEFRGRVGGLYNLNINLGYTCESERAACSLKC